MMPTADTTALARAWLALSLALGVHVADEALTGFLAVYNPTALAIRDALPWLPIPVFGFGTWLAGLILAVLALCTLSVFVCQGARWTRPAGYALAVIMIANALGHTLATVFGQTVNSVRFPRPVPGFYSSPLLLAASVYLILRLRSSRAAGTDL